MRKLTLLLLLTASLAQADGPPPDVSAAVPPASVSEPLVHAEQTANLTVSNRDVNRIACPGALKDVFWSKERPVTISSAGANVMVKFLIEKDGEHSTYASEPVDLHVVCDDSFYTMVLRPAAIDSVTVRLQSDVSPLQRKVAKEWGELPLEARVERLTLALYHDALPDGFQRVALANDDPRRHVALYPDLGVICDYTVEAPGSGLGAEECLLTPNRATEFRESDFLKPVFGDVVGVTIDPLKVEAHQPARLLIVRRSVRHED